VYSFSDGPSQLAVTTPVSFTPQGLAWPFSAYWAGEGFDSTGSFGTATSQRLTVVSAAIAAPDTITLTLASAPANTVAVDVYANMDLVGNPADGNHYSFITDNSDDGDGLTRGRPLRRTIDPIYVPALSPTAQSIVFDQPLSAMQGAYMKVGGGQGSGPPLSNRGTGRFDTSIGISFNGGPLIVPDYLTIGNGNLWSGYVRVPSGMTVGSTATVSAWRIGQSGPDATRSVPVVDGRSELPDPDGSGALRQKAALSWDAFNVGAMWRNAAKTQAIDDVGFLYTWRDQISGVELSNPSAPADVYRPVWDPRHRAYPREDPRHDLPSVLLNYTPPAQRLYNFNCASALVGMNNSLSFMLVAIAAVGHVFSVGVADSSGNWGGQMIRLTQQDMRAEIWRDPNPFGHDIVQTPDTATYPIVNFSRWDAATNTLSARNSNSTSWATTTVAPVTMGAFNAVSFGASLAGGSATGYIQQLIVFRGLLTDAEVAALTTWAQTKHRFF
jgi:hypothetical protein